MSNGDNSLDCGFCQVYSIKTAKNMTKSQCGRLSLFQKLMNLMIFVDKNTLLLRL
jgi:hypothetical protein